jgi:sugar O-acyltransferase (sialic acid O-acetyltransferase NeuD family)
MITEVIFWGATGQAKVLRECLADQGLKLVALFDNNPQAESPFADVPIYHGNGSFAAWRKKRAGEPCGFLVAIGGDKGRDRLMIQDFLIANGLKALSAKHRTAFVADSAELGAGSQILAQTAVCVEVRLGRACIVNTGATVDHECVLGDGVHICPGAHLAGCVEAGNYATIGTGAVVLPRIRIGEGAVVGAGAVVTKDVAPNTVVAGNPARPLASNA